MKVPLSSFDTDMIMALRCAYYVHSVSVVPDHEYDAMEKEHELLHGPLPVGSDQRESYTPAQRALCMYFIFSGRFVKAKPAAPGAELL